MKNRLSRNGWSVLVFLFQLYDFFVQLAPFGHVGQAHFTVGGTHFQTVTICHGFIPHSNTKVTIFATNMVFVDYNLFVSTYFYFFARQPLKIEAYGRLNPL
jgi:hypothetical protein